MKSFGCTFFEMFQMGIEDIFAPAAVQIHIMSDIDLIQKINQFSKRLFIPATAEGFSQMIMRINDGEFRLVYQCSFGYQF